MFLSPFEHQRQCAARKSPLDYLQRSDIDQGFVFRVQRMKVRRRVILLEHLNQGAVEGADRGHHTVLSVAVVSRTLTQLANPDNRVTAVRRSEGVSGS